MATQQGSVDLLKDPVAQKLLQSSLPARFAYNWTDGTPRIVPIWFHWNGKEIVLCSPGGAPKEKVLHDGDHVAITIDDNTFPYKVLLVRGTVRTDTVSGVAPEYVMAAKRMFGEEGGAGWVTQVAPIFEYTARFFVTPKWVAVMDFEQRFPSAIERGMEKAQAAQSAK